MTLPWLFILLFATDENERPAFAPFRWALLRLLRAACQGELLKVGPTWVHCGTPAEPSVAEFVMERGFIVSQPSPWAKNITQMMLSDRGRRILESGEEWWKSLSVPQRLFIVLTE